MSKNPTQQYQQHLYDVSVEGSLTGDPARDLAAMKAAREAASMEPNMAEVTIRIPAKLAAFMRFDARKRGWNLDQLGEYIAMRVLTAPDVQANLPIGDVQTDEDFAALADLFLPVADKDLNAHLKAHF
jgi:hypothetical protein